MKESINLVSAPSQNSKPAYDFRELKEYLKRGCAVFGVALLLEFFAYVSLNFLVAAQIRAQNSSERKLSSLLADAELVSSLMTRQKQLDYIKKQRPNLKNAVSLVQSKVPENLILESLKVEKSRAVISAKTSQISSFSQFINGLVSSKFFKKISLTQSSYSDESQTFSFTLECLVS